MRRRALAALAAAILALSGVYAATVLAGGSKPAIGTITTTNNAHNKVTICHATGSKTNPYVVITPDASGVIDGHYAHQDHRDIIPAFDYVGKDKVVHHFPGQNWTAEGQAIFNNDRDHDGTGDDGGLHRPRPDPDRHGDESDSDRHHEERRQGRQGRPQEGH